MSVGCGGYLTQIGSEAVEITVARVERGTSVTCDQRDDVAIVLPGYVPELDAARALAHLLLALHADESVRLLSHGSHRPELQA